MDEELGRDDVELFGDGFADDRQCLAAGPAGAGLQFVAMFDPRQMGGQQLAPGTAAWGLARQGHLGERLAGFRGAEVGLQVLLEQPGLVRIEPFGRGPEPPAPETGQFELQGLDLDRLGLQFHRLTAIRGEQGLGHVAQFVVAVRQGIGKANHGGYFTMRRTLKNRCSPRQIRLGRISTGVWTRRQSAPWTSTRNCA